MQILRIILIAFAISLSASAATTLKLGLVSGAVMVTVASNEPSSTADINITHRLIRN